MKILVLNGSPSSKGEYGGFGGCLCAVACKANLSLA